MRTRLLDAIALLMIAVTGWTAEPGGGEGGAPPVDILPTSGSWRGPGNHGVFPGPVPVVPFAEGKHIRWKTALPNWGVNAPLVVGDRVFVVCEHGWKSDAPLLVCVALDDGKILWERPVDHLDVLDPATQAEAKAARKQELEMMRLAHRFTYRCRQAKGDPEKLEAIAAEMKAAGFTFDEKKGPLSETARKGGWKQGMANHRYLSRPSYGICRENKWFWVHGWRYYNKIYTGQTFNCLVSDGASVYVFNGFGAVASFDLQGNRRWLHFIDLPLHWHPYGKTKNMLGSPLIIGDLLVVPHRACSAGKTKFGEEKEQLCFVIAYDRASGEERWRTPCQPAFEMVETPAGLTVDGVDLVTISSYVLRASDGKTLGRLTEPDYLREKRENKTIALRATMGGRQAIAHGDLVIFNDHAHGGGCRNHPKGILAYRLGIDRDGGLTQELVWQRGGTEKIGGLQALIFEAERGEIYVHREGLVLDVATGKTLRKVPKIGGMSGCFANGRIVAGDEVGGKSDKQQRPYGFLLKVVDARSGALLHEAQLLCDEGVGEKAQQRIAQWARPTWGWGKSPPIVWKGRILIRSTDNLYCIGGPEAGRRSSAIRTAGETNHHGQHDRASN